MVHSRRKLDISLRTVRQMLVSTGTSVLGAALLAIWLLFSISTSGPQALLGQGGSGVIGSNSVLQGSNPTGSTSNPARDGGDELPLRARVPSGEEIILRNRPFVWLVIACILFTFSAIFLRDANHHLVAIRKVALLDSKINAPVSKDVPAPGETTERDLKESIAEFVKMDTLASTHWLYIALVGIALLWIVRTLFLIRPADFASFAEYSITFPEIYTAGVGICAALPATVGLLRLVQAYTLTSLLDVRPREANTRFLLGAFVLGLVNLVASVITIFHAYHQSIR